MALLKICDPIYKVHITFICHEKKEKAIKFLKQELEWDYSDLWESGGGFFVGKGSRTNSEHFNYYIVLTDSSPNEWEKILAHEALHVTSRALRARGFKLTTASEEAFTYFLGYIVEHCTKFYKQHLKKRKR